MEEKPAHVDDLDPQTGEQWRFYRTPIEDSSHLTNGRAWIQTFEHVLKNLPRPRRTLGVSLSDSGDPRYSMPAFGPKQRNEAAKAMREPASTPGLPEGARHGVGRQLRLPSGDEVLIVSNVGQHAPSELPRKFREMALGELSYYAVAARCPHMGGCLNEGEIKDVEDIMGPASAGPRRRALIRCPWHNWQFDLQTGEGIGNHGRLPTYPVRVHAGAVYVGVRLSQGAAAAAAGPGPPAEDGCMDVDMDCEGPPGEQAPGECCSSPARAVPARSRSPPRQLRQHSTAM